MILRLLPLLVFLAGCVSTAPAPVKDASAPTRIEPERAAAARTPGLYTVKKGDTLHSIALDHGVDYRDLAVWNGIDNPNRIRLGQQLRVSPAAAPAGATEKPAVITDGGSEIRPISLGGAPVARSLDEPATAKPASAVLPAPTFAETDTGKLKRSPKGGKLPYSEENLARLKAQETVAASPPTAQEKPALAEKTAVPVVLAAPAAAADVDWAWPGSGKVLASFSEGGGETNKGLDIAGKIGEPVQAAAAGKVIYVGVMNKYGNLVIVLHGAGNSSVYAHNSKILVKEGQMVARGQKIAELGDSDADQPKLHFEIRQQGKPVDPLKFLPPR